MFEEWSVLCWNYRGARSNEFHIEIKDLIRVHRPLIIILLEPRINGEVADSVCKRMGKRKWVRSEADGVLGWSLDVLEQ